MLNEYEESRRQSFDMGDFLQNATFKNLQKGVKATSKIALVFLATIMKFLCSSILSSWENTITLSVYS